MLLWQFSCFFAGSFVYNNIIVPWPYRHELRSCLDTAKEKQTKNEVEYARNICFRAYSPF